MKKVIIWTIVFLIIAGLMAMVFFQFAELSKAKKEAADMQKFFSGRLCLPSIEKMVKSSAYLKSSLGDVVIFSNAENFKKGLPSDLPADLGAYPGAISDQSFYFPAPYFDYFRVQQGILFGSDQQQSEAMDSYAALLTEKGWKLTGSDAPSIFKRSTFSKDGRVAMILTTDNSDKNAGTINQLASQLGIKGKILVMIRY